VVEDIADSRGGLQNLGDGYYQFNWKASSSYKGTCQAVTIDVGDGVTRGVRFQFKK
jgi:hypothetical protein